MNKASKCLSAERSEIGPVALHQVYSDACDAGFHMIDTKGQVAEWVENHHQYSPDNEYQYSEFIPTAASIRRFPQLHDWYVVIFND